MRSQVVMNPWLPMAMQDGEIWERLQEGAVAVYRAAEDSGQQPEASRVGSLHMASEISVETPQKIECLGIAPTIRLLSSTVTDADTSGIQRRLLSPRNVTNREVTGQRFRRLALRVWQPPTGDSDDARNISSTDASERMCARRPD